MLVLLPLCSLSTYSRNSRDLGRFLGEKKIIFAGSFLGSSRARIGPKPADFGSIFSPLGGCPWGFAGAKTVDYKLILMRFLLVFQMPQEQKLSIDNYLGGCSGGALGAVLGGTSHARIIDR